MVLSLPVRIVVVTLLFCAPLSSLAETVLLDFSSPGCGPCQQMRPIVQRLKADGLPVREVDITREPQLAARFGVTRVPMFVVAVDGRAVDSALGIRTYRQLHRMVRRAMPTVPPRQPIAPLGQSPDRLPTFKSESAAVAAIGGTDNVVPAAADLSKPQAGRIVSLQNPAPTPPRATAQANPFSNSPRPVAPIAGSPNPLHQRLLAATVKITVDDPQGKSAGTGTIVDTRSGEALILTCGHIFRSSAGQGAITITTFNVGPTGPTPSGTHAGVLMDYDLERDLAVVRMRPTSPVQAVSIAGVNVTPLAPNATVTSVGCNHGQNPTAIDSRVTSIDRYEGTPNVEVAGAPVEGRSGGGLFNAQGQLVGVCYAADPQANEGLYAGLPSIYAKLDSLRLTMIYRPNAAPQQAASAVATAPAPPVASPMPVSVRGQEPEPVVPVAKMQALAAASPALPPAEQAALEEISRRGVNSEVICIIRPQDPEGKSEVITLNNASPGFVQALTKQQSTAAAPAGLKLR